MCFDIRNLLYNLHSLDYATKHRVFVVQPWLKKGTRVSERSVPRHPLRRVETYGGSYGDEELRSIRVGSSVGHANGVRTIVPQAGMKFVLKFSTPY